MIIEIYAIATIFALILLYFGEGTGSFAASFLGLAIIFFMGLSLWSSGLEIPNGTDVVQSGNNYAITNHYTNYMPASNAFVELAAYIFCLVPPVLIVAGVSKND